MMGWVYALVTFSFLPICLWAFIKGTQGSGILSLLSGLLFALSPVQSQAVIWFFLSFLAVFMVRLFSKSKGWVAAKSLAIVLTVFALGNAYWIPSLLLYPPSYAVSSDIVSSAVSLGTMGHYQQLNTLRAWGSLYNFQFETIQTSAGLAVFSFFAPVLAIIGLLTARSPYKWAFALLMLSPIVLIFLGNNRGLLAMIPFANAFRDVPRFSVLALLGTSVLAGLGAGSIFQWAARWGKFGQIGAAALVMIGLAGATYPWWSGEMTNWQATKGPDIRLRFKEFPASYFHLESRLAEERLLQKAMYYPLGGTVSFQDDPRFNGAYQETQDIFAKYSPVPGVVDISDRKFGAIDTLMERLAHDEPDRAQLRMLSDSGVRLFIFRRNMLGSYPTPSASLVREMVASGEWRLWFEDREVIAYAAKRFKPTVFTAPDEKGVANSDAPTVEFRKLDSTLYRVRIHDKREPFMLVFNETYNAHWRLGLANSPQPGVPSLAPAAANLTQIDGAASRSEVDEYLASGWLTPPALVAAKGHDTAETRPLGFVSAKNEGSIQNDNLPKPAFLDVMKMPSVAEDSHFIANGFANGWILDPEKVCKEPNACIRGVDGKLTMDLVIEFMPQRVFYIGGAVTLTTLFLLFGAGVFTLARRMRRRTVVAQVDA